MKPITLKPHEITPLLEGKEVEVRRDVKPEPDKISFVGIPQKNTPTKNYPNRSKHINCPLGTVGEIRWVRESWHNDFEHSRIFYKADIDEDGTVPYLMNASPEVMSGVGNARISDWKSPVTMPKWASRMNIKILSVKIEKVGDKWWWVVNVKSTRDGE